MRRLTVVLAILMVMIAAGMMTARGQAWLGLRLSSPVPSVTVIKDPPPAQPARQAVQSRPPVVPATPAQTGIAQISRIANVLLNLPQVFSQRQVQPGPRHRAPDEP